MTPCLINLEILRIRETVIQPWGYILGISEPRQKANTFCSAASPFLPSLLHGDLAHPLRLTRKRAKSGLCGKRNVNLAFSRIDVLGKGLLYRPKMSRKFRYFTDLFWTRGKPEIIL